VIFSHLKACPEQLVQMSTVFSHTKEEELESSRITIYTYQGRQNLTRVPQTDMY
jgi:hypothetical protein